VRLIHEVNGAIYVIATYDFLLGITRHEVVLLWRSRHKLDCAESDSEITICKRTSKCNSTTQEHLHIKGVDKPLLCI